jgi:hypothetical protein
MNKKVWVVFSLSLISALAKADPIQENPGESSIATRCNDSGEVIDTYGNVQRSYPTFTTYQECEEWLNRLNLQDPPEFTRSSPCASIRTPRNDN